MIYRPGCKSNILAFCLCLAVLLFAASCDRNNGSQTESSATSIPDSTTTAASQTTSAQPEDTSETSAETTTAAETTDTLPPETEPETEATSETAATTGEPPTEPAETSSGPAMFSSYAHMVSYDPARGSADFDYFNMLRGDDAVQYLVDNEGYTLAEAQNLVDDFADSEFVYQNDNPQLRTIDLRDIDLKLMYYPDGTQVTGAEPVDSDLIDLYDLYHVDPDLVLDSFFYYITAAGGEVTRVEQVYWP